MVVLGVLARVDAPQHERVCGALGQLPGVSTFSVGETQRVGILVERETIEEAHAALSSEVGQVPGVMAAWPVFSHIETLSEGEQ